MQKGLAKNSSSYVIYKYVILAAQNFYNKQKTRRCRHGKITCGRDTERTG